MKKKIGIISTFIAVAIISGCGNNTPPKENTVSETTTTFSQPTTTTTTVAATTMATTTTTTAAAPIVTTTTTDAKKSDISVSCKEASLATDYKGEPILVVTYIFSHTQDKPTAFSYAVSDTAYQNGIECDDLVISDYVDTQTQLNKIKANVEYEVVVGYKLLNTTDDVEIIVNKLFSFTDDDPICQKIYKLQ